MTTPSFSWPTLSREGLNAIEVQARERGQAEGHRSGYADGMAQAAAEIESLRQANVDALHSIGELRHQRECLDARHLAEMIHMICSSLIDQELSRRPEVIQGLVAGAIDSLGGTEQPVDVRVHSDYADDLADIADVRIIVDDTLPSGSCSIQTTRETILVEPSAVVERLFDELTGRLQPSAEVTDESLEQQDSGAQGDAAQLVRANAGQQGPESDRR